MSDDVRKMIDKVKNFKQLVNENTDFSLNNDNVKNHIWNNNGNNETIKYNLGYDQFTHIYTANLLGGEFFNTYGQGYSEDEAVSSLKIRLLQLRKKI